MQSISIYKGFIYYFTNYINMAISKENFILVYRLNDLDSAECAVYYASARGLDTSSENPSGNTGTIGGVNWQVDGQLVGISCSNNEILSSSSEFNTNVLNPIKDAISNANELQGKTIWGIILGYNVPGGYQDGDDIISSTSRISRLNHTFDKKLKNKFYNRSIFKRFDSTDAEFALICSRIDAPTLALVKEYIDNAEVLKKQRSVNGKFYLDPYSDRAGTYADEYKDSLVFFKNNKLTETNLDVWSTTFLDPYIDVSIPYVLDDSFVWSWFTNRGNSTFFQQSSSLRVFFYNADYDSGYSVRNSNSNKWVTLSLNAGYVCAAGALSNPSYRGFLNPTPFFDALIRGATIGEAYMVSVPYLNWTISLFGDPLASVIFYGTDPDDEDKIKEHESWLRMSKEISRTIVNLQKKSEEIYDIMIDVVNLTSENTDAEVALLPPIETLYKDFRVEEGYGGWVSQIKPLIEKFFEYPLRRNPLYGNVDAYLSAKGFKVSRLLDYVYSSTNINSRYLLDEGWWQFEFIAQEEDSSFVYYHYKLNVYSDSCYTQLAIPYEINSYGIRNWTWEQYRDTFSNMVYSGVPTSHVGRRVRYESRKDDILGINEYLTRGETYYFTVTPYDIESGYEYPIRYYSDIIYT